MATDPILVTSAFERRIQGMNRSDGDVRTDEELLAALRSDQRAIEALYRRCVGVTVAFAAKRCDSPEQVHDLVAAIWLEVIEASGRYDPMRGAALPWILGVAGNLVNDARRRRAREREALKRLSGRRTLESDDVERLVEAMAAEVLAPRVLAELGRLPREERESVELLMRGLSQAEAAEASGVAPATYRMRLSRARRRLKRSSVQRKPEGDARLEVTEG